MSHDSKVEKARKIIRDVLDEHAGPGYDAHKDSLSDHWDHAESANKLALALREVQELLG